MPNWDFFVFCTSLPPAVLRSIGASSQVRHIPEGRIIYNAGDFADTLYIINRGSVDLLPASSRGHGPPAATLSRGGIFGDLELLTASPRRHSARAREEVSLQCFEKDKLLELLRAVPAFHQFLSGHMAHRLMLAGETSSSGAQDTTLSGKLAHFDVVTVYQTITMSHQTGDLSIENDDGDEIARFHFASGEPHHGRFLHLTGQEAFWQLFLTQNARGMFCFTSVPYLDEPLPRTLVRPANDLLFAAIHHRDEFRDLAAEMPASEIYEIQQPELDITSVRSGSMQRAMKEIWSCASRQPTRLSDFFARSSFCELKIYQAVRELVRTGQLGLAQTAEIQEAA